MRLSAKTVAKLALAPGKSEVIFFDEDIPGFGLRIRKNGSRTWIFQYKLANKQRRITLGSQAAISADHARDGFKDQDGKQHPGATHLYAKVKLGTDPVAEMEAAIAAAAKANRETFKTVADQYLKYKRTQIPTDAFRESSYADLERHLMTHAKPLHSLQLEKITRRDIASCLNSIKPHKRFRNRATGVVTRNRVRASLSAFFSWSIGEGAEIANPVVGTNRGEEKKRDRVLKPAEIRVIWNALEDDHYGGIMKLLALLGQREVEIAGLRLSELWEVDIVTVQEVDGIRLYDIEERRIIPPAELAASGWHEVKDGRRWPTLRGPAIVLPGERTKNKRRHVVCLIDPAREIVAKWATDENRPADKDPADLIFGYGKGPFSGWSKSKLELDERIAKAAGQALAHWTPHDLRRSFSTHAHELAIEPHIVEATVNHISGHKQGVSGTYNWARYEAAKRHALIRWANHLMAIVEGRDSNVTPLRRGA